MPKDIGGFNNAAKETQHYTEELKSFLAILYNTLLKDQSFTEKAFHIKKQNEEDRAGEINSLLLLRLHQERWDPC